MSDLISRQAAIDALGEKPETWVRTDFELGARNQWDKDRLAIETVPSAQRWIPVSERLPEDFEEVNVTWVNRAPEQYYADIKDVPFVSSGVFYKGRWYWWSAVCVDYLREYGNSPADAMDDRIEVVAWTPLMEPYKEGE